MKVFQNGLFIKPHPQSPKETFKKQQLLILRQSKADRNLGFFHKLCLQQGKGSGIEKTEKLSTLLSTAVCNWDFDKFFIEGACS